MKNRGKNMIISMIQVEYLVMDLVRGTNIELFGVSDIGKKEYAGIELDLFDYLDKITDFESDVKTLIKELEERLPANMFISDADYSEKTSINDIDGLEYPDYHAFVQIVELI